jgi:hypothetical protein
MRMSGLWKRWLLYKNFFREYALLDANDGRHF